mgnify:CR=1 FL=1
MLTTSDTIIRLILAFILGSIIGLEREAKGRSAGLRTHILVCVGSSLIMLISVYIYHSYNNYSSVDPARIAAGVVTGIGFLGAGAIIRSRQGSRGLTTAASVWVSAAIGLAVGCGYFLAAIISTGIIFLSLAFLKKAENKLDK